MSIRMIYGQSTRTLRRPMARMQLASAAQIEIAPRRGGEALVSVRLGGSTGPHRAVIEQVLRSGRIALIVRHGLRTWHVITEPNNVYPIFTDPKERR